MRRLLCCGLLAVTMVWGCSSDDSEVDAGGETDTQDTPTDGSTDTEDSSTDSDTGPETDTDSSTVDPEILADRLDGLPSFELDLPGSLSGEVKRSGLLALVLTPDDVEEVRSEAVYQIQEEQVFPHEIYDIRGLLALIEKIAAEESPAAEEVINLGVRTDLFRVGGPGDGEPINPHVMEQEPYEGVDCGWFKWWLEDDTLKLFWHVTDAYFGSYPYWVIEVGPSSEDELMRKFTVAGLRGVWDGVQRSFDMLLLIDDEATDRTTLYYRNTMGIDGADPEVSYQVISRRPQLGDDGAPMENSVELYKENGELLISEDEPWRPRERLLAVGDGSGGGVTSVTVPGDMWSDEGVLVDVSHLYVETYDAMGNLLRRMFARNYDKVPELSAFSWFQPETESFNVFAASPQAPPSRILFRQVFDLLGGAGSTVESSVDGENWADVPPEKFALRPVWRQVEGGALAWSPGDVLYEMSDGEDSDCSIEGETICTLWTYLPIHVFPEEVQWFGESFHGEEQWPVTRVAVPEGKELKIETSEIPPYATCWLESDGNDLRDQGEQRVPCAGYDVYYYTPAGELVDATLPMIYGFSEEPPAGLSFDETAANLYETVVSHLRSLETGWAPGLSADHGFVPPSEEELQRALGEIDEPTGNDTDGSEGTDDDGNAGTDAVTDDDTASDTR